MQTHHRFLSEFPSEAVLQQIAEQMMIAVPFSRYVERHDEQVGLVQVDQHLLPVGVPGQGVAQRTAQPLQDRSLQEEVMHIIRLPLQDLFYQIVLDVSLAAGERSHR